MKKLIKSIVLSLALILVIAPCAAIFAGCGEGVIKDGHLYAMFDGEEIDGVVQYEDKSWNIVTVNLKDGKYFVNIQGMVLELNAQEDGSYIGSVPNGDDEPAPLKVYKEGTDLFVQVDYEEASIFGKLVDLGKTTLIEYINGTWVFDEHASSTSDRLYIKTSEEPSIDAKYITINNKVITFFRGAEVSASKTPLTATINQDLQVSYGDDSTNWELFIYDNGQLKIGYTK